MSMFRTFRYRLYPTVSQQENIRETNDACRFVYNWALEVKKSAYQREKTSLSTYDFHAKLPELKKEYQFLKGANSQSLQQSIRRLNKAFQNFFRRVKLGEKEKGYPKFRSRRYHRQSFDAPQGVKVDFEKRRVYLPKIVHVKTVFHRRFEGSVKTCTIITTNTGKYFICIAVDDGKIPPKKKRVTKEKSIGIDVGLKTYATMSNGEKIENPRFLQSSLKRVQCLHKRLSRKKKGSRNREKSLIALGKHYEKITNQRRDFQQKLSTKLIRENQGIFVESLNVSGMRKNRRLSRAISDAAWSSFLSMLKYKSEWYGITVIGIGMFEPSTKLCHKCGYKNDELILNDREWTCPQCKTEHDRDENAAINIKMIGLEIHSASVEHGVEPVELSGLPEVLKQETQYANDG